ncbi:MAG TPA: right-handed parallel beta-helix repeat-containing protein, partial [Candidatus Acidoferrum sp.]|nr:right-handed parallel beta-helix repeat-containing protein [Candidatus Acidoferrum sp.]
MAKHHALLTWTLATIVGGGVVFAGPQHAAAVIRQVTEYGAACDGVTDDTGAIQAAIDATQPYDAVEFPASRTCVYTNTLTVYGKTNLDIRGFGKTSSLLRGTSQDATALQVFNSQYITVRDLRIESPNSTLRSASPAAAGVYVKDSVNVEIRGVAIWKTAQTGVFVDHSQYVGVYQNDILDTKADGVHITNASNTVVVQYNFAYQTGDDSFASVTYGSPAGGCLGGSSLGRNQSIGIYDNVSQFSAGSGVTVAGSQYVVATRNQVYRSFVAGIRVESEKCWPTEGDLEVEISANTVTESPTQLDQNHPAILVYTNYHDVVNTHVTGNSIVNPVAPYAVRAYGLDGAVVNFIEVLNNTVTAQGMAP